MSADSALAACLDARLLGIQLPGVYVDERRLAFPVDAANAPAHVSIRKQPEVRTAPQRPVAAGGAGGAHGKFPERPFAVRANREREPAGVRDPVEPVGDGKDARVVSKAALEEDVERPERRLRERKRGRTVTQNRGS